MSDKKFAGLLKKNRKKRARVFKKCVYLRVKMMKNRFENSKLRIDN